MEVIAEIETPDQDYPSLTRPCGLRIKVRSYSRVVIELLKLFIVIDNIYVPIFRFLWIHRRPKDKSVVGK